MGDKMTDWMEAFGNDEREYAKIKYKFGRLKEKIQLKVTKRLSKWNDQRVQFREYELVLLEI